MEVDIYAMPDDAPWAVLFGTCDNPFLLGIEAIGVGCPANLVENPKLYQVWVFSHNHFNLYNVGLSQLLDISLASS